MIDASDFADDEEVGFLGDGGKGFVLGGLGGLGGAVGEVEGGTEGEGREGEFCGGRGH